MESDAAVTATGDDGCNHLAIDPEDGESWATTRTSSWSAWLTLVRAVAKGMRTVVRLSMDSHLRSMLRLSLSVLVRDTSVRSLRAPLRHLHPGECFAEGVLLEQSTTAPSLVASADAIVLRVCRSDYFAAHASTVRLSTLKIFVATAVVRGRITTHLDESQAFQRQPLESPCRIFVWPPKELERPSDEVWELDATVQGTKQGANVFQKNQRAEYADLGFERGKGAAIHFGSEGRVKCGMMGVEGVLGESAAAHHRES